MHPCLREIYPGKNSHGSSRCPPLSNVIKETNVLSEVSLSSLTVKMCGSHKTAFVASSHFEVFYELSDLERQAVHVDPE
jgi:hypothetical protein